MSLKTLMIRCIVVLEATYCECREGRKRVNESSFQQICVCTGERQLNVLQQLNNFYFEHFCLLHMKVVVGI